MTETTPKPEVSKPAEKPVEKPVELPIVDDPLIVEYADNLKSQLGDLYEKEYDKLSLKERIATMKIIKKTMDKLPARSEGKPPIAPEPEGLHEKVKNHVERWNAGQKDFVKSSIFSITQNK